MRFGGRVQPVDRVGGERNGRIEPETVRRADNVVVDRLRDADERNPALAELVRNRQRAVAANHNERVESHPVEHLDDAFRVHAGAVRGRDGRGERIARVDGAENRAAQAQDARDVAGASSRERSASSRPSKLSSMPRHVMPALHADLTTARMTAFKPGASPPPVRIPIRCIAAMRSAIANGHPPRDDRDDAPRCEPQIWHARLRVRSSGRLAQLGERRVRNAEAGSSILPPSTNTFQQCRDVRGR